MAANKERTFIMVKPDGVQRGLVGKIIERFEQKGFKLVAMKFTWVSTQCSENGLIGLTVSRIDWNFGPPLFRTFQCKFIPEGQKWG